MRDIIKARMDYSQGRLIFKLSEPFEGIVGNIIDIKSTIARDIIFDSKEAQNTVVPTDPFFAAQRATSSNIFKADREFFDFQSVSGSLLHIDPNRTDLMTFSDNLVTQVNDEFSSSVVFTATSGEEPELVLVGPNQLRHSEDLTQSVWVTGGASPPTIDNEFEVSYPASTDSFITQDVPLVRIGDEITVSVFMKVETGTDTVKLSINDTSGELNSITVNLVDGFRRFEVSTTAVLDGVHSILITNDTTTTKTVKIIKAQFEYDTSASQYNETSIFRQGSPFSKNFAFLFDGLDDQFSSSFQFPNNFTLFTVTQFRGLSSRNNFIFGNSNFLLSVDGELGIAATSSANIRFFAGTSFVDVSAPHTNTNLARSKYTRGSQISLAINGGSETSISNSSTNENSGATIVGDPDAGDIGDGYVGNIIVYEEIVGTTDQTNIENELARRAGITI